MPYSSMVCRISSILEASSQEAPHTQWGQEAKRRRRHIDGEELEAAQIEHKASEHHEAIDAFSSWLNALIDVPPWLHSAIIPLSYTPDVEVDLLTPNDVLHHMEKPTDATS